MDKNEVLDFFKDLAVIIIIVLIIRTFVAMPFQIKGQSMYSSYYDREFIIVDRLSYYLWEPKRWDVIVFKPYVSKTKEYFLKRIIWVPWDSLKIDNWNVYIKKKWDSEFVELNEPYLNENNRWSTFVDHTGKSYQYSIWEWQYYVIWDNRNHSTDSRKCFSSCSNWRTSFIETSDITGKVFLDLWYFNFKSFSFIQPELGIDSKPKFFSSPSTFDY